MASISTNLYYHNVGPANLNFKTSIDKLDTGDYHLVLTIEVVDDEGKYLSSDSIIFFEETERDILSIASAISDKFDDLKVG